MALEVDETMIPALTGLAQVVSGDEAAELIERAVGADPRNHVFSWPVLA